MTALPHSFYAAIYEFFNFGTEREEKVSPVKKTASYVIRI